jgi:hypothetical protein
VRIKEKKKSHSGPECDFFFSFILTYLVRAFAFPRKVNYNKNKLNTKLGPGVSKSCVRIRRPSLKEQSPAILFFYFLAFIIILSLWLYVSCETFPR